MKKALSIITAAVLACSAVLFTGCSGKSQEYTSFAMGSVMTARIYTDEKNGAAVYEELNEALQNTDLSLSATNENSDIYRLNKNGSAKVGSYTLKAVSDSIMLCNTVNRITDISIGAVSELWGFATEEPHLPSAEDISDAIKTVNCGEIAVDTENSTVSLPEGMKLDLGAAGKGAACEEMRYVLDRHKIPAVVSFGGTVLVYGKAPSKEGWKVGVRNPSGSQNDYMGIYTLTPDTQSGALYISTSGKYEKNFTENGKTYHHILSTETGYPVDTNLAGVTVVAPGGMTADILSTTLFINGLDSYADTLIKSFGAGVLFIYDDGTAVVTGRYSDCFTLTDTSFTLSEHKADSDVPAGDSNAK